MFLKLLNRYVRWTAVNLSCLTMVLSPVAMGRETEAISQKQLQQYLQEFGLDKKTTLGEFWEKSKAYYPGFIYKDLEKFVQENKNLQMPVMTVTTAKATDGSEIPVLRMNVQGKTNMIQFFGEKNNWAKYNSASLGETDLRSVTDAFKRIEASDIRIKNEADKIRQKIQIKSGKTMAASTKQQEKIIKDFARFKGFPRISPLQWKSMTPAKRAGYIVNMRLLWKDARQVLRLEEASLQKNLKGKKKYSTFEEFYKIMIGEEVQAAGGKKKSSASTVAPLGDQNPPTPQLSAQGLSVVTPGEASTPKAPQSKKCIVAGYVSEEGKGSNYAGANRYTCSEVEVFKSEKYNRDTPEMKMVRDAKFDCQDSFAGNAIACNPLIYGYTKAGSAICVDLKKKTPSAGATDNYQKATWWEGPCDSQSKLTESQVQDNMKESDTEYSEQDKRFDENGKIKSESAQNQINKVEEDQFKNNSYQRTKEFLDSVLQNKKKKNVNVDYSMDDLIQGKKPWTKEIDDMIVDIQSQFEVEIGEAIQSCEKSITRKDNVDRNQKGACDQLHRRWLFTERFISEFRSKSCLGDSTYIWKIDSSKMSSEQIDAAKLNKEKIKTNSELMCECKNNKDKKIKFNDDKSCAGKPVVEDPSLCPEKMLTIENGKKEKFCTCAGSTINIPLDEALQRASLEGVEKMCAKPDENKCDKPKGIVGYDYNDCSCTKGDLTDENEKGIISKIFHKNDAAKEPNWVCKEKNIWPWVLGGLGILALFALFNRHKRPSPPVVIPPKGPACSVVCTGNTTLNPTCCKCDVNPPTESCAPKVGTPRACICPATNNCVPGQQVYNLSTCQCDSVQQPVVCANGSPAPNNNAAACPKCSDGSYRTTVSFGRPDGCPQVAEGGSGNNTCKNPPCSGGVPTGK